MSFKCIYEVLDYFGKKKEGYVVAERRGRYLDICVYLPSPLGGDVEVYTERFEKEEGRRYLRRLRELTKVYYKCSGRLFLDDSLEGFSEKDSV